MLKVDQKWSIIKSHLALSCLPLFGHIYTLKWPDFTKWAYSLHIGVETASVQNFTCGFIAFQILGATVLSWTLFVYISNHWQIFRWSFWYFTSATHFTAIWPSAFAVIAFQRLRNTKCHHDHPLHIYLVIWQISIFHIFFKFREIREVLIEILYFKDLGIQCHFAVI